MARYVITFSLPAAPGAELRASALATQLDAALIGLRGGAVRDARLVSRNLRGSGVARVKASMTVTVRGGLSGALEAAEAALAAALGDSGPFWDLRMLSAEVRPAAT
jgi:hypothetical protein